MPCRDGGGAEPNGTDAAGEEGVYHGLRRRHVQRYLDGSVFRRDRRRHRRTSLDSPGIGLRLPPATYRDLIDGRA